MHTLYYYRSRPISSENLNGVVSPRLSSSIPLLLSRFFLFADSFVFSWLLLFSSSMYVFRTVCVGGIFWKYYCSKIQTGSIAESLVTQELGIEGPSIEIREGA